MQYSDIRENFECKQEELYNFISKEKLIEQIKDNYNDVTAYGSAVIQWKNKGVLLLSITPLLIYL